MSQSTATWAVVELMGHVKLAGIITEEEKFGAKMGRLDIPNSAHKCTGLSASWCPVCGDCTCDVDGERNAKDCKLHSPSSKHGDEPEFITQLFTGSSVYRITFVTEEVARQVAKQSSDVAPVKPWDFPKPVVEAPALPWSTDDRDDNRELDCDMEGL